MLLFVQFVQVSRAMTTYENMYGVNPPSFSRVGAYTSTGAPLDPSAAPPSGSEIGPHAPPGHGHHHHHRRRGGVLKHWAHLLGIDTFIETARGSSGGGGGGAGARHRKRGNPYSRGCVTNCRDFWCDPAPLFGRRETGAAVLGGVPVNYTEMYESPEVMEVIRGRGGYEAVPGDDV
ncbi:hypothetical protein VTK26DRAFT_9036 [Humicola hyalothermophila]